MQDQYLLWKTEQSYYEARAALWKLEVCALLSSILDTCLMLQQGHMGISTMQLALQGLELRFYLLAVVMICDDLIDIQALLGGIWVTSLVHIPRL